MTVAGTLLSIVISVQHADRAGDEGHEAEGRFVAEMVIAESLGTFRNVTRMIFLIAAAAEVER
jgi:hypothetical protein